MANLTTPINLELIPEVWQDLQKSTNKGILDYVANDAFGAHVFPGDLINYSESQFLVDTNEELAKKNPIHLWVNLPTCERRCFFCQFPVVVTKNPEALSLTTQKWLDANLKEAALWLKKMPNLISAPIGEFNILGGTPTLLTDSQIEQLISFYKNNFNFTRETTIRIEGTASTFTVNKLKKLKELGVSKVSSGIQSFDDEVLTQANCAHRSKDAIEYIMNAKKLNFDSVNADFIYGLMNQTPKKFLDDIQTAIDLKVSCIVITKLHLKTFLEKRTAVSGGKEALWQKQSVREKLQSQGHHWPTLAEQYGMREAAVKLLEKNGYKEHPTMYFYHPDKKPEKWKSLIVDQDKQFTEIGIGMGGSSACNKAEAINMTTPEAYFKKIDRNCLPLESIRGFSQRGIMKKSIQMALSSCQPLQNSLFKKRFPNHSLFNDEWLSVFKKLEERMLIAIDFNKEIIQLTPMGRTLVEAIIHTEI